MAGLPDHNQIIQGDNRQIIAGWPDDCIDAIVTDPPAGIAFMGKDWDRDKGGRDAWIAWMEEIAAECLRVLKPGGHALVWSIPRTAHWTAMAWENARFELRDKIYHCFGSGFPKSLDVSKAIDRAAGAEREVMGVSPNWRESKRDRERFGSIEVRGEHAGLLTAPTTAAAKQWQGWGTALKPAIEEWHLFRKPLIGTVAENIQEYGTGALSIDACRIPTGDTLGGGDQLATTKIKSEAWDRPWMQDKVAKAAYADRVNANVARAEALGRWPANLIHDGSDKVMALFPQTGRSSGGNSGHIDGKVCYGTYGQNESDGVNPGFGDSGSAARFFYCAKASRSERGEGNNHPTVKPLALMRYLCRLVTPPGGIVLDPFCGSGSTCVGAKQEGFRYLGIEQDAHYCDIARRRLEDSPQEKELFA